MHYVDNDIIMYTSPLVHPSVSFSSFQRKTTSQILLTKILGFGYLHYTSKAERKFLVFCVEVRGSNSACESKFPI